MNRAGGEVTLAGGQSSVHSMPVADQLLDCKITHRNRSKTQREQSACGGIALEMSKIMNV